MRLHLCLVGTLLAAPLAGALAQGTGLTELSRIPFGRDTIILYGDASLSPALRDSLWNLGDGCFLESDHPLRRFCTVDFDTLARPAVLRLVRPKGLPGASLVLSKPLARIAPVPIKGLPFPEFFVTEDDQVEFGSYRGPLTRILLIRPEASLEWAVIAPRARQQNATEIRLSDTGKAQWVADSTEVRVVRCQPISRGDSVAFAVTLSRLRPLPQGFWEEISHTQDGFWEADMGIPDRQTFPAWP